ncbi:MAG: YidC/Oxa1 family membrane protein insertase [Clostridia bacterium]|nr:YidC/Oxa1 family membrane protein insertase [Clostridia bacterium]MBQ6934257.1 YidC/Oxa1 family membrane protein insertase [Clostridia bacterium]
MLDIIAVPFGYIMRLIYEIIGNYGLSIIAFSLLAKLVMLPFSIKTKKSMLDMQRIQPKLNELQRKYGKDQQKLSMEMQKLYQEEGVSPFGSCLPTLITFPIMIGLYYVISKPLTYFMGLSAAEITTLGEILGVVSENAYTMEIQIAGLISQNFDAVAHVSEKLMNVDFNFFGLNLATTPSFKQFGLMWLIPILSGVTAYLLSNITMKMQGTDMAQNSSTSTMKYMMPLMSVYFGFILPAGLGVYWIANNVFSALQEVLLGIFMKPKQIMGDFTIKGEYTTKGDK